jgi:cell division protein FtsL
MSKESQRYGSDRSFDPETRRYSRRYEARESSPVPELVSKYGDFENDTEGFMARMKERHVISQTMYSDLPAEQVDAMFAAFDRMPPNLQKQMGGSIPFRVVPEPVSSANFYGAGATLISPAKTGGVPSSPAKTGGVDPVLVFPGKAGGDAICRLVTKDTPQDIPQDTPVKFVELAPEKPDGHLVFQKIRETEDVVTQLLTENDRLNSENDRLDSENKALKKKVETTAAGMRMLVARIGRASRDMKNALEGSSPAATIVSMIDLLVKDAGTACAEESDGEEVSG